MYRIHTPVRSPDAGAYFPATEEEALMKRFSWMVVGLVVVLSVAGPIDAAAQMSEEHKAEMELLERLVGEWTAAEAVFEEEGRTIAFEMELAVRPIVEGWALEMDVSAEMAEIGPFAEKDFLAYDPLQKEVALMTVTNYGEVATYRGNWVRPDNRVLKLIGIRSDGEKQIRADVTITFLDDDEFEWESVARLDGKPIGRFHARFSD